MPLFSINSLFDPAPEAQTIIPRPDQGRAQHVSGASRHPKGRSEGVASKVRAEGWSMPLHWKNRDGEFWTLTFGSSTVQADVVIGGLIS